MFEGSMNDPSQTNKLELNLGSDSTEYIPTRLYDQFSMTARADHQLTVTVHWQYKGLRESSLLLPSSIGQDWVEIGPFDLTSGSSGWASEDVKRLWLEFSGSNMESEIRIGDIRLTE